MTWTRFDDGWGDRPDVLALSLAGRWHLSELIRWCSRTKRYDGKMRSSDARRCSDVDDPDGALEELVSAGHLVFDAAEQSYVLVRIDDHVPPPHMRDEHRKAGQRERQQRRRERLATEGVAPTSPPEANAIPGDVTRDPRTGQDRDLCSSPNGEEQSKKEARWPATKLEPSAAAPARVNAKQGAASAELALVPRPDLAPAGLTTNQRAQALARAYTDVVPMSKFPAILGIAKKALQTGHDDDTVRAALLRLADDNRPVTVDTLRIEMGGPPRRQNARPTATERAARTLALMTPEPHQTGTDG